LHSNQGLETVCDCITQQKSINLPDQRSTPNCVCKLIKLAGHRHFSSQKANVKYPKKHFHCHNNENVNLHQMTFLPSSKVNKLERHSPISNSEVHLHKWKFFRSVALNSFNSIHAHTNQESLILDVKIILRTRIG
jgi:hypothetical protein